MKTRFFTIAPVLLFATTTIAEAINSTTENSNIASRHESNNGIEMIAAGSQLEHGILDEWISTRENWEQENQEIESNEAMELSQLLEEWVSGRETWEQGSREIEISFTVETSQLLEEWFTGRENWEQESQEVNSNDTIDFSELLEEWMTSRNNWEQQ